jgi:hypothetical protein
MRTILFLTLYLATTIYVAKREHHLALIHHANSVSTSGTLHVGTVVDLSKVRENINKTGTFLWRLHYYHTEEFGPWAGSGRLMTNNWNAHDRESTDAFYKAKNTELAALDRRLRTAETLSDPILGVGHRSKRFVVPLITGILALVGTTTGIYNLVEQARMKEALEEASDFTLGLARIQEDDLSRFTEDEGVVGKLHSLVDKGYQELMEFAYYHHTDAIVAQILAALDQQVTYVERVMDAMHSGRLGASTLPDGALEDAVRRAAKPLAEKGYRPVYDTVHELLQCHVSATVSKEKIHLFLHVPLTQLGKEQTMWRHVRELPIKLADDLMLEVEATHPYLVVDEEDTWFKVLTEEEVSACRRTDNTLVCDTPVAKRIPPKEDTTPHPAHCMWHLYRGNVEGVKATCKVHARRPVNNAVHLHDDLWMVEQETEATGARLTCDGVEDPTPVPFPVLSMTKVKEGCFVTIPDQFHLEGQQDLALAVKERLILHKMDFDPAVLLGDVEVTELRKILNESKGIADFPSHLPAITRFARDEDHYQEWRAQHQGWLDERPWNTIMTMGSLGAGNIALLLVVFLWIYQCCGRRNDRTGTGMAPRGAEVAINMAERGQVYPNPAYTPSAPTYLDPNLLAEVARRMGSTPRITYLQ